MIWRNFEYGETTRNENKVRLGLQGSLDPKKTLQNSITARFTESPRRDPTACCGGFTVFHGKPLYARPRLELNSLSYSIFCFVCVAHESGKEFRASPLPFETAARPYLSTESHRTLQGGTGFAPVPGNKLPGYHHLVPPGQRSRENEAPR